jgi:F-type H+-transporting ATPase subunit epsilon
MAEHTLGVEIVTPEEALFAGEAKALLTATSLGDLTIMADHAEMIGDVAPGVVRIETPEGETLSIAVHGGFLQVTTGPGAAVGLVEGTTETERTTRATILAGIAEFATGIDLTRAEQSKQEAEARLAELRAQTGRPADGDDATLSSHYVELAEAEASLARAELRISTASPLGLH